MPYGVQKESSMTETTHIAYLFDPLCGWCYGASAVIKKLAEQPGLVVELMPTGLFANERAPRMDDGFAAYAWANDQRIARLTGQAFSDDYRSKVLADRSARLDSGPATLALTAVSLTAPDREIETLRAVQSARYVGGHDITSTEVLVQILRSLSLNEAAGLLQTSGPELVSANQARLKRAQSKMRQFHVDGVPVLVVSDGQGERLISANGLIGDTNLVAKLSGEPAPSR
jgi:putative protein-disulfide isomerase